MNWLLLLLIAIPGSAIALLDLQYRRRVGNKLAVTAGTWDINADNPSHYKLTGTLEFVSSSGRDVMVPEITADATLLSGDTLQGITTEFTIIPRMGKYGGGIQEVRPDNYWESYIVEGYKREPFEIQLDITGPDLRALKNAWVRVNYLTYGPESRVPRTKHIVIPLAFPDAKLRFDWKPASNAELLPIKTHLLTQLDDPAEVVKRYVTPHAQPGDIITIGESPVAIMQGRFRYSGEIKPGWLARRLCYLFTVTSSLATANGLQALIDIVGAPRVFFAFLISIPTRIVPRSLAKKLQIDGTFYRLAGEQARLVDDVTGTLPPYDKFVILGPDNPQAVCDRIQQMTGLSAAVVDVNDLRRVKILAATSDVSHVLLQEALITNPAGNANEQTPVVLVRPH